MKLFYYLFLLLGGHSLLVAQQPVCKINSVNRVDPFCTTCSNLISPDGLISGELRLEIANGGNRTVTLPFSCGTEGQGELRLGDLDIVIVSPNNILIIGSSTSAYTVDPSAVNATVSRSTNNATVQYNGTTYVTSSGNDNFDQAQPAIRAAANAAPIELLSWTATPHPTGVALAWASASEVDNDFYTIEHSTDGSTFRELTRVPGSAASEQVIAYGYLHLAPGTGSHYYRLAQQDFDGTRTTFDVLAVTVGAEAAAASVSPNPARAGTTITLGSLAANNDVSLLRIDGSLIAHYPAASRDLPQITLPADLPAGSYLVRTGAEVSRLLVR